MNYYVIVVRREDGSVLALPSSCGWTVPTFTPDITDARIVEHINAEMQQQLGLNVWTLRCAARGEENGNTWRVFIAVTRETGAELPSGAQWLRGEKALCANFANPAVGKAIAAWFAEIDSPSELFRAPWTEVGWHDAAIGWISAQLAALGFTVQAPIVQQRAWGLSCTMKVSAEAGNVYFKATPSFMAHEGRAMQIVSEQCPQLLPPPLAVEPERGWLLMADYGSEMLHECPDVGRWEEALRLFSQAQVEQVEHTRQWLSLNIPDRRLGRLVEMIDPLISSCSRLLADGESGLSEAEVKDLRTLSMPLKLMCARLADFGVPHTLVHGDLGGNIIIRKNGIRKNGFTFFDWTDVCVSHPFFDMATVSAAYIDRSALLDNADTNTRLRNAYLEPWTKHAPFERLVEAFEASRPLGALHQAMSYMWILTNISADARPELEGGLLHWVRQILRLCSRVS